MDSKKSKKARIFLVVVILLSAAVWKYIGHEKKEKKIEITEAEADQTRVAFSMAEGDNPWTVKLVNELNDAAREKNMELIYHEPETVTAEWQKKDIEALLEMDIDYLAVFPRDEKILPEILTKAEKKKVPVILITKNLCYRNRCAALISIDYELEGQLAARVLAKNSKGEDCNIVEIKGPEESTVAQARSRGFRRELVKYPNLKVIAERNGDFDRLTAENVMEEVISSYGKENIQAVFASSDEEGLGILSALKITGCHPGKDVDIVLINGIQDTLKAIVAGEYTAAILSGNKMGFVLFEIIARRERGFDKGDFVVIPYQIYDSSNAEKYLLSLS